MLKYVPAYTLEELDQCDIERMLGYYLWNHRRGLAMEAIKENSDNKKELGEGNVVYRGGKPYEVLNDAPWA